MLDFGQDMSFLMLNLQSIIDDTTSPDFLRWAAAKSLAQEYISNYELFTTMSDRHLADLQEYQVTSSNGDHGNNLDPGSKEAAAFSQCMLFMLLLAKGEGIFFPTDASDSLQISASFNRMLIMTRLESLRRQGKIQTNPAEFSISPEGDGNAWVARDINDE